MARIIMEIKSLKISIVPLDDLMINPQNRNLHPEVQVELLKKNIIERGFREPLTISNQSGFVVCGHLRLECARQLGMEKLPVIYQDFNEGEEYAHMMAENESARHSILDKDGFLSDIGDLNIDPYKVDYEMFGLLDFDPFPEKVEKKKKMKLCPHCGEEI